MAPLHCVYVDLDGTLLGRGGSLFADPEGNFSMWQARALQACDRAEVEVVIMSGRREAQVHEDARLIGQRSYVYEAGCGVVVDGEATLLTGSYEPRDGVSVHAQIAAAGAPDLLLERYAGRLELHHPWHVGREHSHLFRGSVDVLEANELLEAEGHGELYLIDNGAIGRRMEGLGSVHAYHLMPKGASKADAVALHADARGYAREDCIAIGDSLEDLATAGVVGRFFCVANGPERDPGVHAVLSGVENAVVTEAPMGEGVYEAIVGTLME